MAGSSDKRTMWRRREALPIGWGLLSEQQQRAVHSVAGWLLDVLASLDSPGRARGPRTGSGALDFDRRSQISFIDGDRGTGKTSVLLTLRALTTNRYSPAGLPPDVDNLRQQRNRVRWLETLDMEPLSSGTNLFAAILARVAALVEQHIQPLSPMASALADPQGGFEETSAALQQLQNDAAIVWDRIDAAAPDGDPQLRALWVNQAEKAGLDLNGRIGQVMDGVARLVSAGSGDEMLFVLPVDDFDLAPAHCLELLRLIRMITTPRLVFVVAGSVRVAETVLQLKSEGDLAALAGPRGPRALDYLARASEIAANNLRKLVPPGQRVILRELSLKEALKLGSPSTPEGGGDAVEPTLRSVLDHVVFESNQAPPTKPRVSLAQFLSLDRTSEPEASSAVWFAGTPRQVLDYVSMMEEIVQLRAAHDVRASAPSEQAKQEADDAMVVRLLEELRRQIGEEWRLPTADRERMRDQLDTKVAVRADFGSLVVEQEYGVPRQAWAFEHGAVEQSSSGRGRVSMRLGTAAPADNRKERVTEEVIELPRRVGAGLMLMHDVVVSIWGGYLRGGPLTYSASGNIGPRVQTRWRESNGRTWAFPWPIPEWWTFRDIERFDRALTTISGTVSEPMGQAWLAAMLSVYFDEPVDPSSRASALSSIDGMLARVIAETPQRTARHVLRNSVLVCAALLYAPEYSSGLTLPTSGKKQAMPLFDAVAGDLAQRICEQRTQSLRLMTGEEQYGRVASTVRCMIWPKHGAAQLLQRAFDEASSKAETQKERNDLVSVRNLYTSRVADKDQVQAATQALSNRTGAFEEVLPWLKLAESELERWSKHPFNAYRDGLFVPTNLE